MMFEVRCCRIDETEAFRLETPDLGYTLQPE